MRRSSALCLSENDSGNMDATAITPKITPARIPRAIRDMIGKLPLPYCERLRLASGPVARPAGIVAANAVCAPKPLRAL